MIGRVASESRQVSERIERPVAEVYEYAANPANLSAWAPGLGGAVTQVDGRWFVETSDGRVEVRFAPRNEYGVLDHHVTLPSGEVCYNPFRAIADGDAASEVVFTVRRLPGLTDAEFDRDAGLVAADLHRLKHILESRD